MKLVRPLTFEEARAAVLEQVAGARAAPAVERIALLDALGRVLARDMPADRDYPPAARSIRDGFALRAEDTPGVLRVTGEVRAGEPARQAVAPGEAIEIMTGAPVPEGADAIVMVEHASREGDTVNIAARAEKGQFVNPRGAEATRGETLLERGTRIDYTGIAALATIGASVVDVFARPAVAILPTGDEVLPVEAVPLPYQVRNSNAQSLAAQVRRAGGAPILLSVARDDYRHTQALIEEGLESDLLLMSGGVSAGKYDIVERVLAGLGAEFFFDRVLIQPGQPLVFGRAAGKFFFGLPGNPASTIVTFEIFARAAVELLAGERHPVLRTLSARLTKPFRHKAGLTRFLPALVSDDGAEITPMAWKGSSDVAALARAGGFLVADPHREEYVAGDAIRVLLK
jgi:molybdopterin molybdotransferase